MTPSPTATTHALKLGAWLAVFTLTGCFFNADIPSAARVKCGPNGECPKTLQCNSENRCVRLGDILPPVITAAARVPAAKAGDKVFVDVASNELLLEPPELISAVAGWSHGLTRESDGDDNLHWVYSLVVTTDAPEGLHGVYADATDLSGNRGPDQRTGASFQVDATPPSVDRVQSTIAPLVARSDSTVTVTVVMTEPVKKNVGLVAHRKGETDVVATGKVGNVQASIIMFALPVGPAAGKNGDEVWQLSVTSMQDLAGNDATAAGSVVGDLVIDGQDPVIDDLGLDGKRFSANPLHNEIVVPVKVSDPLATVEVRFGAHRQFASSSDSKTFTVTTADPEGPTDVVVTATDIAGNTTSKKATVIVDFTPPIVLTALVDITPPVDCPLVRVSAVRQGTGIHAFFSLDEPSVPAPTVTLGSVAFSGSTTGARDFRYDAVADNSLADGQLSVKAVVTDEVGNSATRSLATPLTIDRTPPTAPSGNRLKQVVFSRAPWGAESTNGVPRMSISADAGSFEANASVFFYDGSDPLGSQELGRGTAAADGRIANLTLASRDVVELYLAQFDNACNRDAAQATRVTEGEWIATLGKKVVDSKFENPHEFRAAVNETMRQGLGTNPFSQPTNLTRADNVPLVTTGDSYVATLAGARFQDDSPALVWDEYDSKLLFLPAAMGGAVGYVGAWTGEQLQARVCRGYIPGGQPGSGYYDPVTTRDYFLSWTTSGKMVATSWNGVEFASVDSPTPPSSRVHFGVAWDKKRNTAVMFGGRTSLALNETWFVNGGQFTRWDAGSLPEPAPRFGHRVVYDSKNERVLAYGGVLQDGGISNELLSWEGAGWNVVATTGTAPPPRAFAGVAYDSDRDVVVVAGGTSVDGNGNPFESTETYELDSNNVWTRVASGFNVPHCGAFWFNSPNTVNPSMGFDPVRKRSVLVCSQRIYEWDGRTKKWTYRTHARDWDDMEVEGGVGAFDTQRQRAVSVDYKNTTWVRGDFIGFRSDAGAPPDIKALTYDAFRDRIVGIRRASDNSKETVIFNPSTEAWSTAPASGFDFWDNAMLAYDSNRHVIVAYDTATTSTFEWDGSAWNNVLAANSPSQRGGIPVLYFDSQRGTTQLLGGAWDCNLPEANDQWEWDGGTWAQRTTVNPPPSLCTGQKNGAFDPSRNVFVLGYRPPNGNQFNLWELDAQGQWSDRSFVYDQVSDFGFAFYEPKYGGVRFRSAWSGWRAWVWSGSGLRSVRNHQLAPPRARLAAVTYDSVRQVVVVFSMSETWEFDGVHWFNRTDWSKPTPPERGAHVMAFDAAPGHNKVVLYGGSPWYRVDQRHYDQYFTDTWTWDGNNWTEVIHANAPPGPRMQPVMHYNPQTQRVFLQSGSPGGVGGNFEWTGSTWVSTGGTRVDLQEVSAPGGAYNYDTQTIYYMGGGRFLDGLWDPQGMSLYGRWTAAGFQQVFNPAGIFTDLTGLWMVYDPNRKATIAPITTAQDPASGNSAIPNVESMLGGTLSMFSLVGVPKDFITINTGTQLGFGIAVYDKARATASNFDGDNGAINQYAVPGPVVPVHEFQVEGTYSGLGQTPHAVTGISASFVSGGTGIGASGASLEVWNGFQWLPVKINTAPSSTPALVEATVSDPALLKAMWDPRRVLIRTRPRSPNDAVTPVKLSTDYAEVRVRYSLQ